MNSHLRNIYRRHLSQEKTQFQLVIQEDWKWNQLILSVGLCLDHRKYSAAQYSGFWFWTHPSIVGRKTLWTHRVDEKVQLQQWFCLRLGLSLFERQSFPSFHWMSKQWSHLSLRKWNYPSLSNHCSSHHMANPVHYRRGKGLHMNPHKFTYKWN